MRQQKRKRTGKKEKKRGLDGQIEGGVEREIEGGGEREIERLRETERERERKTLHCSVLSYFMFLISPLHIAEHQLRGNEMRSPPPPPHLPAGYLAGCPPTMRPQERALASGTFDHDRAGQMEASGRY